MIEAVGFTQNDFFRVAGLAQQEPRGFHLGLLDPPA